MQVTVNYTLTDGKCTAIASVYIESQFITDFVDNQPTPGFTLSLEIDERCGTGTTQITLDENNIDLVNKRYEVTANDITLADGVYEFRLIKTETSGNITTDTQCSFLDCNIKCTMLGVFAEDLQSQIGFYYMVLNNLNACEGKCTDACKVYAAFDRILSETLESGISVNNVTHKINEENGCGC